jgi:hypothetical protein|tara:strand:+ start:845 stop:1705 length:861 start_codon:yes stop_codon:yes gene_type:complete
MLREALFVVAFALPPLAFPQQSDITFIVAGKTSNHRQQLDGSVKTLNYHFFAEIFRQHDGIVYPASIRTPFTASPIDFTDGGHALEMHGGRYPNEQKLEAKYPDGDYVFLFSAPSIGSVSQTVVMTNQRISGSGLPAAPLISLSQAGVSVAPDSINPALDLVVTWSEFYEGRRDPLGIMDDLLFVIMADCQGERIAHSGRPFENTPFLSFDDESFVIGAEILHPENAYQLSVEHAILNTSLEHGVPAFATFATTTFLDLMTIGSATDETACPNILEHFDAGQTALQ